LGVSSKYKCCLNKQGQKNKFSVLHIVGREGKPNLYLA